jgi:hypothetical protein
MITWSSSIDISRPAETVFDYLANIQKIQQTDTSPVVSLDLTTAGPPKVGSRYREVVQMMPFFKGEFLSEITKFDPPRILEMDWTGPGMAGTDRYEFTQIQGGTKLKHTKWVGCPCLLRIAEPFMRGPLFSKLQQRLRAIKCELEGAERKLSGVDRSGGINPAG